MIIAAVVVTVNVFAQQTKENGIKMYHYKKYQSAAQILEPLAADPVANYYLGLTYLGQGDAAKASATFSKFPEDPANISGTARVAFANKDVTRGMAIAKDLAGKAKKKDWVPQRYAAEAIAYSEGGDYQQAITWYKDALTKTDDAEVHIGIGDAFRRIPGGGGEAMTNYEHVAEKDPKNSLAYSRIGDLWYEARNYQSALDNYAKAKDADNTNPLPYKALSDAFARSGKYQLALENVKKYFDLSDKTHADKMDLLRGYYRAQSSCEAAKYAQEMLGSGQLTGEDKIEATGILGYSQSDCGDSIEALKNLRVYFQVQKPERIKSGDYIQLGKLYLKLGQLDSAGFFYTKGIAGDTAQNKSDVYREIADAFKSKKDYCKSAEWYDNLVKANPNAQAGDYAWRGIMYYYCRNYGQALTASTEFAAKYPDQPSSFYWQARSAAAIDSEATTGGAEQYYLKWLEKVGPNYDKKNDLKTGYEYLLYYYYNKKDKANEDIYKEKIRAIDPKSRALNDIEEAEKASAAPKKPTTPAKK